MTFLAPLAGLLAAAVALPILLGLYLLKLRRRPLRVSSTLLWEQAVQDLQANVPLRWLKWSWLFLLQMVAIACVLVAIARPAIPGVVGEASRVIVLIDRSASMSCLDGAGGTPEKPATRLDEARRAALGVVEQALHASSGPGGRTPEIMIVGYAAEARTLTRFTSSRTELTESIQKLDGTDQPDDLGAGLDTVRALDAGRDGELVAAPRTSVVVITDHAVGAEQMGGHLPAGTSLRTVLVGPATKPPEARSPTDNLGIVALSAARDANTPATARVFVRVISTLSSEEETTLSCRVDDRPAGVFALKIPGAAPGPDERISPGAASATFELEAPQGGLVTVAISRPDVLACDNQGAVLLGPATRPKVLVVGPGDEPEDPYRSVRGPSGVDRFLWGVLQELDLSALRVIDAAAYKTAVSAAETPSRAWADYDLIIFDRVTPAIAPSVPTLSIGAGLPSLGVRVEAAKPGDPAAAPTRFALWTRTHPVFRYGAPDAVLVAPPMKVYLPPDDSQLGKDHAFTELAQGASGPLVIAIDDDRVPGSVPRRIILAFDLLRTNWGPDVTFPVFVASAVDHLTGRGDSGAGVAYTTTQSVAVVPLPGAAELHVRGPREFTVPLRRPATGEQVSTEPVSLGVLDRAGVYVVEGARLGNATIAVNMLSERESSLAIGEQVTAAELSGDSTPAAAREKSGREIWHWFIGAAGALSCLEWIVYALRSRT